MLIINTENFSPLEYLVNNHIITMNELIPRLNNTAVYMQNTAAEQSFIVRLHSFTKHRNLSLEYWCSMLPFKYMWIRI